MTHVHHTLLAAAPPALLAAAPLAAQPVADPSGHWEGALQVPSMQIPFSTTSRRTSRGSSPAQSVCRPSGSKDCRSSVSPSMASLSAFRRAATSR